jgi:hypothetical protein
MTRRCIGVAGIGFFAASLVMGLMFPIVAGARQAQASTSRGQSIGGKFMCMCGCNQVLTQCNHVGCTTSTGMLKQIDDAVTRGDNLAEYRAGIRHKGLRGTAEERPQPGGVDAAEHLPGDWNGRSDFCDFTMAIAGA